MISYISGCDKFLLVVSCTLIKEGRLGDDSGFPSYSLRIMSLGGRWLNDCFRDDNIKKLNLSIIEPNARIEGNDCLPPPYQLSCNVFCTLYYNYHIQSLWALNIITSSLSSISCSWVSHSSSFPRSRESC